MIFDRFNTAALVMVLALMAGCGGKSPRTQTDTDVLPDLPSAKIAIDSGDSVVFHGQRVVLGDRDEDGVYSYTVGADGSGNAMRESAAPGEWRMHRDLLLMLTERTGREGALLSLYWMPKLKEVSGRIDPSSLMELREGEHLFFEGGFVSLDRVRPNDPGKTDDERAEITLMMDGVLRNVAVIEFGSVASGDMIVSAENVYDGERPGDGQAQVRVSRPSEAWSEAVEAREIVIQSGSALEEGMLVIRTDTLEDREGGWRALVSMSSAGGRRDAILREEESLRIGAHELRLVTVLEERIEADLYTYPTIRRPEDAFVPGVPRSDKNVVVGETKEPDATRTTRRVGFSESFDFQGARFTFATMFANDPTSVTDDAAEIQVAHSGTLDRIVTRPGQRHTVQGNNQWWIVEVKELTGGKNGQAQVSVETGRFVGQDPRKSRSW